MKKVSIGALRWDVGWSVVVEHQSCTNTFRIATVDIGEVRWSERKASCFYFFEFPAGGVVLLSNDLIQSVL